MQKILFTRQYSILYTAYSDKNNLRNIRNIGIYVEHIAALGLA